MSKYEPSIAEVLSDASLVDNTIAKLPTIQEELPKGFSKGSYTTLRNLKKFYKPLNEGKSPNHSLIIRRTLSG